MKVMESDKKVKVNAMKSLVMPKFCACSPIKNKLQPMQKLVWSPSLQDNSPLHRKTDINDFSKCMPDPTDEHNKKKNEDYISNFILVALSPSTQ